MNEESDEARLIKGLIFTCIAGLTGYCVSTILVFVICLPFGLVFGRNAVYWTELAGLPGAAIAVIVSIVYFWRAKGPSKIVEVRRGMSIELTEEEKIKP